MTQQTDRHRLTSPPACCPKCGAEANFIPRVKITEEGGIEFTVQKCRDCGYEFEVEIVTEPEPLECCSICGKDLFAGDEAAGVTLGAILEDYHGFGSDDEPWDYVFCRKCYSERFIEIMGRIEEVLVFLRLTEGGKCE